MLYVWLIIQGNNGELITAFVGFYTLDHISDKSHEGCISRLRLNCSQYDPRILALLSKMFIISTIWWQVSRWYYLPYFISDNIVTVYENNIAKQHVYTIFTQYLQMIVYRILYKYWLIVYAILYKYWLLIHSIR